MSRGTVQGIIENLRILAIEGLNAVAVMDVKIDDEKFGIGLLTPDFLQRQSEIIDEAETFGLRFSRVVPRRPGQSEARYPLLQRLRQRQRKPAGGENRVPAVLADVAIFAHET